MKAMTLALAILLLAACGRIEDHSIPSSQADDAIRNGGGDTYKELLDPRFRRDLHMYRKNLWRSPDQMEERRYESDLSAEEILEVFG